MQAVTWKDAFADEDWQRIRSAPWVVALGIVAADPSGAIGTGMELDALRRLVAETDAHGSDNELIRAVARDVTADRAADEPSPFGGLRGHESIRSGALAHCRAVVEILGDVAEPAEAEELRRWLLGLGHGVAAAAKEGGFLGRRGIQISEAEEVMLAHLAEALDVQP